MNKGNYITSTRCIANEIEGKENCNSSDAMAIYKHSDKEYDSYCWSCQQSFTIKEFLSSSVADELGVNNGVVLSSNNKEYSPLSKEIVKNLISEIGYKCNNYRGIKEEYNKFFGHLTKLDNDGNVLARYYPETNNDKVVGYKCRNHPKDFTYGKIGYTGIDNDLSGEVKFKSGGKYLLIVGGECYSADTEVLTDVGFVKFEELTNNHLIYQHDITGSSFVKPERFIKKEYDGEMIVYNSKYIDLLVTPNHKILSLDYEMNEYNHCAKDLPKNHHHFHKVSKIKDEGLGVNLTNDQIRFIVALSADSKIDTRKSGKKVAHFAFIKDRKIKRLKSILDNLGLSYTEVGKDSRNWKCGRKYHTFNVILPDWVRNKGFPNDWVRDLSLSQRILFLDEITLWDGNKGKYEGDIEFSSKLKEECEKVYSIAITAGKHAHIRKRSNDLGEWYCVNISWRKVTSSYQAVNFSSTNYKGLVYCVTVPSGNIVVRRNGKTVVSGNCDKVAAYQMFAESQKDKSYDVTAVVSPTVGESGAHKQLARRYQFIDSFDIIVLGFDNDEAGRIATEKACKVLPQEKLRIATWSGKDPNKMLLDGKEKQFLRDFYNAKEYIPSGIKHSSDSYEAAIEFLSAEKIKLPPYLHKLEDAMRGGIKTTGAIINLIGDTSIGKCHGEGTKILRYDGTLIKVEDIKVGDLLMGADGSPRTVINTTKGVSQLYTVHQKRGVSYTVNDAHILSLRAGYDCLKSGVKKGDIVNIPIKDYMFNIGNKLKRSLKGYKSDLTELGKYNNPVFEPYMIGLWLADGTQRAPSITFNKNDSELIDCFYDFCNRNGYVATINKHQEKENHIAINATKGFYKILDGFNLRSGKYIPDKYLFSNYSDRIELLSGILDGDGYLVSNGYEIVQKDKNLSGQIVFLARSLGLDVTIREKFSKCQNFKGDIYYRIFIYGDTTKLNLRLKRKKVVNKSNLRRNINTTIEIEDAGVGNYYGFQLDGDHLYCLEDFTVTHNSIFTDSLLYYWFWNSPIVPTIVSLERTDGELAADFISMHLKHNLAWYSDGKDAVKLISKPENVELIKDLLINEKGEPRYHVLDERSGDMKTLFAVTERAIKQYGSRLIIFDPLTDFLRSLGTEAQEEFMMWEKRKKKEGVIFFNILHTRKPLPDKDGNIRKVTEYDALGSGTFVQSADGNIVINRDKMNDDPIIRNTTSIDLPKMRGGRTGYVGDIYYEIGTRTLHDRDDYFKDREPTHHPVDSSISDKEIDNSSVDTSTGEITETEDF